MAATEIDVGALVSSMGERLAGLTNSEPYTFPRVPAYIRERNKNLYEPMVIAIGPYHHHIGHLQTTEEHKWRYLRDFLARPTTTATLEICLKMIKYYEQEARRCYGESFTLTSDEFVEMMIPFFIIEVLFGLAAGGAVLSQPSLTGLIQSAYGRTSLLEGLSPAAPHPAQIHHLLHLYYHWFVPAEERRQSESPISLIFSCFPSRNSGTSERSRKRNLFIPSATELSEAGVTFTKKGSPGHKLDITFRNGEMEIPFIQIGDFIKPILTNLVAFEQSISDGPRKITSFSLLMDSLINTEKDVAILQQCGIISNLLGSGEEVALFFNQLGQYATISRNHYFAEMFKEVNHYCDSTWHRHRAKLKHDYFSSPWSILSLVAALILLALTFLQTFFALYSYFRPRN
ncbi:UPF0481 protein At3g47200-like [Typha angustifolia]|uniref:UPF0481 protein At3g47200-like n=1 Tax=Typha angustifolia TaxID=59011 RepID=UPI003C2D6F87